MCLLTGIHKRCTGIHERRLKIISRALNAVKLNFPDTTEFIEDCLEQECLRENITVEEVIFLFTYLEAKSLFYGLF